jgi:membrane associated rhomboid family serine protease
VIPLKDNLPTGRFPVITVVLIVINLCVFGWQLTLATDHASTTDLGVAGISERDQATIEYGAIPFRVTHPGGECGVKPGKVVCGRDGLVEAGGRKGSPLPDNLNAPAWWVTLITSMFMHAGWLHIGFNMLFLWIFGNNVEDAMGRGRYVLFYLLAGLVASYAQAGLDPSATVPSIGASGAIAGVLGAYAILHPKARVLSLIFIVFFVTLIEVPALVLLAVWFLLQFIPAVGQLASSDVVGGGDVAYLAHIGGFVFGLVAVRLFARRREPPEPRIPVY